LTTTEAMVVVKALGAAQDARMMEDMDLQEAVAHQNALKMRMAPALAKKRFEFAPHNVSTQEMDALFACVDFRSNQAQKFVDQIQRGISVGETINAQVTRTKKKKFPTRDRDSACSGVMDKASDGPEVLMVCAVV